ncbi:MAG: Cd2+/Zn2+-exporting ATPase [Saprospiraceae bacterium]|jgi:Cd2+/Zn2+-exporting ATPase
MNIDHKEHISKSEEIHFETIKDDCCQIKKAVNKSSSKIENPDHGEDNDHNHGDGLWPAIISFVMLIAGLLVQHFFSIPLFSGWIIPIWYLLAYLPVGLPVLKEAWNSILHGEVFNEFFLMGIATIGAFAIGEYPEGVAVMLFYAVGEIFQMKAVERSKNNIQALLDVRPKNATVYRNDKYVSIDPKEVNIGERVQIRVGEKIPLDGVLLSNNASLNTAALTGESLPQFSKKGASVLAGTINISGVIDIEVTNKFQDSSISRILELVQNASKKKSKTELLIRRLAKIYTPIVVYLAISICILPFFLVTDYVFSDWLYRALVFLVISCPCALVISIPLGYFGGLGAASKNGILFKGATYLDQITNVNTIVIDKTGTVTHGVFAIQDIKVYDGMNTSEFMRHLLSIESKSVHPIAKALLSYELEAELYNVDSINEISGKGLTGIIDNKQVVVGNTKLIKSNNITIPTEVTTIVESLVHMAIDGRYAGYVVLADQLKEGIETDIEKLKKGAINRLMMLSGDKDSITQIIANKIGITEAIGSLLPEDKLRIVNDIKKDPNSFVAFVGDGINDAPVLAVSDVGIAMGGLGSDVAIETADIIIQNDRIKK